MRLKALAIGLLLALLASSSASAQCSGNPAAGRICANVGATPTLPAWATATSVLDRNFGAPSAEGTILNRGVSSWAATPAPSLGLNGSVGGSVILRGATSGSATISVAAAAGSVNFRLPITNGTVNQVLITDGAGNLSYATAGSGTVSSVGLSMPAIFTVSGTPVTGAGTLTATLATQAANLVWSGPTTGAAAAPTFRALVGADLPNPSASTLGGVQSLAAVSSNWIRQISTSGVPTASQPAFTDISGTLAAAQCPLPGAASVGCVQSFAAVSSQWLRQISTSGVISASQPAFTDISGSVSLSQLPSISNLSILANNSGGTAIPSALSASQVLDMIGSTRGQVLYRGASGWAPLATGTAGFVLSTNGAGADPTWITVAGTGTVQTITAGSGITLSSGATCTVSCTLGLSTVANNSIMANVSGGVLAPSATTLSSVLDIAGSATGSTLYRAAGGTGWTALAAGSNGQVLTMGASTPAWANVGSVTNVTISNGTGISLSGTCNISSTGTCIITATTPVVTTQSFCPAGCSTTVAANSTGTYTPRTGLLYAIVECVGSGGGSGGAGGSVGAVYSGGGGGSGGYSRAYVSAASLGASKIVTIGGVGTAGAAGAGNGGSGAAVSLGSLCVANGGGGGAGGSAAQTGTGGTGGSAGTGDHVQAGRNGGTGAFSTATGPIGLGGAGGSSVFGAGGPPTPTVSGGSTAGVSGTGYGSGAAGGSANNVASNVTGNVGIAGKVIVTEFSTQ